MCVYICMCVCVTWSCALLKAKDITAQWAANMDSKLQEQETRQQLEMAKAMSYLKGIESMVDTVATTG